MRLVVIGAHLRREDVEPLAVAVPAAEVFLSAVEVADDQPLGDRELLLRVAGIREQLLERATFIAIRYGFAASSPAEAAAKCAAHADGWRHVLEASRDCVEMTIKIAASSPMPRPDRRQFTSGAAYLKALHEATSAASVDKSFRDAVEQRLVPLSVRHRWVHRDNASLEFVALVRRERLDDVRAAGEALRATRVPFLLSGPWPLEVFADDDRQ